MKQMKITICTTPIRPVPTDYPPFGSMTIIQSLRSYGYDPYFYDIDGLRPSFEEVREFFGNQQPDVVGISAVVSTAYSYTKKLAQALREILPNVTLIVGGNLAASAELLHRACGVDFCVVGEGEKVIVNLMKYLENCNRSLHDSSLQKIKGITFLNEAGELVFTGYEAAIPAGELFDPDFSILEKYSRIENYIKDPLTREDFAQDPRTYEPHRKGKKMTTVLSAKGCVARCTFCHRWDKGYRQFSPSKIISRIKHLIERYNVGFIQFGDENFGSDRRAIEELIETVKPLNVLYQISGVRCRSVDPPLLKRLKESGCVALYYGMETGSPKMLEVMEKKTSLIQNLNAARWTHEAGFYTIYQLVLGMPGENHQTISETIEFVKSVCEFLPEYPDRRLSINYIQALPGTPVYEFARAKGLIGSRLEDEENYLISISDTNALDDTKFLNFTEYDYLTVRSWRPKIIFEVIAHYLRRNNLVRPSIKNFFGEVFPPLLLKFFWPAKYEEWKVNWKASGLNRSKGNNDYSQGGYFNLSSQRWYDTCYLYFYPFRSLIIWWFLLKTEFKRSSLKKFCVRLYEFFEAKVRGRKIDIPNQSLRRVTSEVVQAAASLSSQSMAPLRHGR